MATLEQFFQEVEKQAKDIPVYRGDFTDWWADGIGSTPQPVKLYLVPKENTVSVRKWIPREQEVPQNSKKRQEKN